MSSSTESQMPSSSSTQFASRSSNNFVNDVHSERSTPSSSSTSSTATQEPASSRTDPSATDFDASNSTKQSDAANKQTDDSSSKKDDSMFECNICLDTAKEAVVSMCGHLFCWPCLHQWLETRPTRQLCPVCKAAISKEKVIPLYGRGSTKEEDPR